MNGIPGSPDEPPYDYPEATPQEPPELALEFMDDDSTTAPPPTNSLPSNVIPGPGYVAAAEAALIPAVADLKITFAQSFLEAAQSPQFRLALQVAARIDPLGFANAAAKWVSSPGDKTRITLQNIVNAIPRSPLDDLPEGFNDR